MPIGWCLRRTCNLLFRFNRFTPNRMASPSMEIGQDCKDMLAILSAFPENEMLAIKVR